MRRNRLLLAAGVAAFLVFLIALLPATLLLRYLPVEVRVAGMTGTIWRGTAASVAVRGKPLGSLRWTNRPWRLLLLEVQYRLELQPTDGSLQTIATLGSHGRLELTALQGEFPVTAVAGLIAPEGWNGRVELDVQRIVIESGFPIAATGIVLVRDLTAVGPDGSNLGSLELTLGEGAVGSEAIAGRLRDLDGGPMRVRATIELDRDRHYLISGEVAAGPEAGAAVQRSLAFLGPPDALGRRPFSIEGTL
jgi:general secretion pathway protein N